MRVPFDRDDGWLLILEHFAEPHDGETSRHVRFRTLDRYEEQFERSNLSLVEVSRFELPKEGRSKNLMLLRKSDFAVPHGYEE